MNTLLWILLGLIALWMALRFLPAGADWHRPLVELIALIDLLAVPLLAILVCAIVIQAWPQSALALIELALVTLWRLQYRFHLPSPIGSGHRNKLLDTRNQAEADADIHESHQFSRDITDPALSLKVMTLNCRYGMADAQSIMKQVQSHDVDVLALQEVNSTLLTHLQKAGMRRIMPYLVEGPQTQNDNGGRNALFSRQEPIWSQPAGLDLEASAVPLMHLHTLAGIVRVASVHPKSPQRGARQWGLGIRRLALLNGEKMTAVPDVESPAFTIIMGDCNANLHHPTFRAMLHSGRLRDASLFLGCGPHPTFPHCQALLPPLIEIDHILVSQGIRVESMKVIKVPHTDHCGLLAQLRL